jgi:hypothetical protein
VDEEVDAEPIGDPEEPAAVVMDVTMAEVGEPARGVFIMLQVIIILEISPVDPVKVVKHLYNHYLRHLMQQMLALRARCKAQASDGEDTANALPV